MSLIAIRKLVGANHAVSHHELGNHIVMMFGQDVNNLELAGK